MLFTDQLGYNIDLPQPPQRIVSLVPSQTELLYELGLGNQIAGQTFFCIHPKEVFESAIKIGGTKTLDIDKIRSLKPDLIIGNKEENPQNQISVLQQEFPVWMSDIHTLNDALDMIKSVGTITCSELIANRLCSEIREQFNIPATPLGSAAYLIWKDPFMVAGKHTFINEMINYAGFSNVFAEKDLRYPETTEETLKLLQPQYLLLSTEPYPFSEKHVARLQQKFPFAKVLLVDGEMFSWYGSRLIKAMPYFKELNDSLSSQLKDKPFQFLS